MEEKIRKKKEKITNAREYYNTGKKKKGRKGKYNKKGKKRIKK